MEFMEKLKQFSERIETLKGTIETEEATKTSLIMPFFQLLGYDVFNPLEFVPEYTADVGIKKGEKVDYAIIMDGEPLIVVECKAIGDDLSKHASQLFRYFGTTQSKFAILTNGETYNFYTDMDATNKMDARPFLTVNLLNLKDRDVAELKKFIKGSVDVDNILNSAEDLKYSGLIKEWFSKELENPSTNFVKLALDNVYNGIKSQRIIEKFTPILKKALAQQINDVMNTKIKSALAGEASNENAQEEDEENSIVEEPKIVTTVEELESYAIVKSILRPVVECNRITYKDTESYFGILLDDKRTKWLCRIYLNTSNIHLVIPDENKKSIRIDIDFLDDIYNYSNEIIEVFNRYENN